MGSASVREGPDKSGDSRRFCNRQSSRGRIARTTHYFILIERGVVDLEIGYLVVRKIQTASHSRKPSSGTIECKLRATLKFFGQVRHAH